MSLSQSAYAKLENGKRKIEANLIFKIAEELDENVDSFLNDNFSYTQNGNNEFKDNSAFNLNNIYYTQKELYEEHIKMLKEEIEEMRKERQMLMELLKGKI